MKWEQFVITLGQNISYPSFWVGFGLVIFFALDRFSSGDANSERDDPRVVPRSFTTRFRYGLSAMAYVGCYEFIYGLLVGIGSLPFLHGLLTQWVGNLNLPADQYAQIGTPAWAALFVTSVIPSAPGFKAVDKYVRKKLHIFASIPYKARGLAVEVLTQLTPDFLQPMSTKPIADQAEDKTQANLEAAQLTWVFRAIEKLQDVNDNASKAIEYKKYFESEYQGIWSDAKQKQKQLKKSLNSPESSAPVIALERASLLNNSARFLSCALLQNEPSERHARNIIREVLGVKDLARLAFDFNLKQIIINFILVFLLTFFGSVAALCFALPNGREDITIDMIGLIVSWLPYTAITMVMPFIFAAGVQLYFMDREQLGSVKIPFEDKLLALLVLFVGTFSVGILPTMLGLVAGNYNLNQDWIMQVVPSGITPAAVALLFYFLSTRHLFKSAWKDGFVDVIVFAAVAGGSSWFSTMVAYHAGMDVADLTRVAGFTNEVILIVSPVTHAVMVGVIGAIQCSISRSNLR